MVDLGLQDMLLRTITGWFAFISVLFFIKDRRTYIFRTIGAMGVQTLAFGMFWYATVTLFSALALWAARMGELDWMFVSRFATMKVWDYLLFGDILINASVGCVALSCRMHVSTKKGRRFMRGTLE